MYVCNIAPKKKRKSKKNFCTIVHDSRRHERNEKGSGSETETEDIHTAHGHAYHEDLIRQGSSNVQASLEELVTE